MKRHFVRTLMILMLLLVAAVPAAYAVLQQVGPVNNAPSVGGYPAWYQDTTGLALEYCDVRNQAEVDGGWCLLLPGDPPAVPEVFPGLFFDEHFWFAADATIVPPGNPTLRALLVLATEAAFGGGSPAPGDQIAFNRIRVRIDPVPVTGTYRVIHPYGEESIEGTAGDRIFLSDDVGLVPGDFTALLTSRLGPFLLPSTLPGGAELAPVTGPVLGKLYIADPGRLGPVTGSPLPNFIDSSGASRNHNIFRIEGPGGSNLGGPGIDAIETTDFSLMGRIFQGPIAGRVTVNRASYARPVVGIPTGNKVDVFATAFPSTQGRIPPNLQLPPTPPQLVYVDGPCFDPITGELAVAGLTSNQMFRAGNQHWGQSAPAVIPQNPAEVCVIQTNVLNAGGQLTSAFFPAPLGDQVLITEALYDPVAQSLSVRASSSDQVAAPTLPTLTVAGFGNIVAGQLLFTPLTAPPAKVSVLSSKGGSNELQVSTGIAPTGPVAGEPVAANDAVTVARNSGLTAIPVLANDSVFPGLPPIPAVGATIAMTAPSLGTAVVNVVTGTIDYTPNPNTSGTDVFTYTVTVLGIPSNVAIVTVTINDPPTAVNDSATATINVVTPISVLANDTDPNGQADIVAVANLTQPTPAGASVAINGNVVNFTGTAVGTYTFTYQAQDAQGALSNVATVTVTVGAAGTITVSRALLVSGTSLVVEGTVTPAGQTLTIQFATLNQAIAGSRVFTVTPRADGRWAISVRNITAPGSATQVKVTSSNGTVLFAPLVRQ